MPSRFEDARRISSEIDADGLSPSRTSHHPAAIALSRLTRFPESVPRRAGLTADPAELRRLRNPILNQQDRATAHVRRTGQNSTTIEPARDAEEQASLPLVLPPSPPAEGSPPDFSQTAPSSGWTIAGLWRRARRIDLEAEADNNPTGFMGVLIALAGLAVAVAALVWSVVQGVAALVLQARSNSTEGVMQQPVRRIKGAWANVRRRADKFAHHIGLPLPTPSLERMHARQWDHIQPGQEKRDS